MHYEIFSDDYVKGVAPDVLVIPGIATCIGIAIYDAQQKQGVLGHFSHAQIGLAEMVTEAREWCNPDRATVSLRGTSVFYTNRKKRGTSIALAEHLRNCSREALQTAGFGQIEERYLPDNNATALYFHLSTGRIVQRHFTEL